MYEFANYIPEMYRRAIVNSTFVMVPPTEEGGVAYARTYVDNGIECCPLGKIFHLAHAAPVVPEDIYEVVMPSPGEAYDIMEALGWIPVTNDRLIMDGVYISLECFINNVDNGRLTPNLFPRALGLEE